MIPLKDNIRTRRPPFVNYGLIAITTIVFLIQVSRPEEPLVEQLGMIPARVLDPDASISIPEIRVHPFFGAREFQRPAAESMVPAWLTLLTCVFLHGGWLHFLGNMWFLHIFGDNVEDRFGHVGFFIFYLAAGVAASATHLLTNSGSEVPTIGASGAIAGVMGAYLVLFPHALVLTLIPIFFFFDIIALPAIFFLGVWFLLQFFQGTMAIRDVAASGVAWWAHIGGFVVGAAVALALRATHIVDTRNPDRITSWRRPARRHQWPG